MKTALFYTFLVIFAVTTIITLLGIINVLQIREGYLTALVTAFLVELSGAVIAIFRSADFFGNTTTQTGIEEPPAENRPAIIASDSSTNDNVINISGEWIS